MRARSSTGAPSASTTSQLRSSPRAKAQT